MPFGNNKNFAIEFAYRTKLNYYQLLKLEKQSLGEDYNEIDTIINEIIIEMEDKEFHTLTPQTLCCGTQLMNSVVGLLVFPEQQLFEKMSTHFGELQRFLPALYGCMHSRNSSYVNTYYYFSEKYQEYRPEIETIKNTLIHMRNSLSHKRIMFYPTRQDVNTDQITDLVFEDEKIEFLNKNTPPQSFDLLDKKGLIIYNEKGKEMLKQNFRIVIPKSEFETVLMEISNYFTSLE